MKALLTLLIPLLLVSNASSQERRHHLPPAPEPTHADVPYGSHENQVFDLWLVEDAPSPTPLVIYIHGGGFKGGSKNSVSPGSILKLRDAGISVASLEYRFIQDAKLPAAHQDCARAIQFLRSRAREWNIDKNRIGATGGSAGAQLCMYLAFHDEMADPEGEDAIARESTRLAAVATSGGQATMDLEWWSGVIPGYTTPHRSISEYFGDLDNAALAGIIKEVSALDLLSKGDPPVHMTYRMSPEEPVPEGKGARGWQIHHVAFGQALQKKANQLGVENHLVYPGAPAVPWPNATLFFIDKLK
ncbi:MAG: alpha/beta hydrolase fold domain-containing protein [Verrucomicrobiales bacterium]